MTREEPALWLRYLFNEEIYVVQEERQTTGERQTTDEPQDPDRKDRTEAEPAHIPAASVESPVWFDLLIAYVEPEDPGVAEKDRVLLSNILKSINKDSSAVHMLRLEAGNPIITETHLHNMPHSTAILFGPDILHHQHQNRRLYAVEQYGGYSVLQVDDLSTLEAFKLKKKALWDALRTLFEI